MDGGIPCRIRLANEPGGTMIYVTIEGRLERWRYSMASCTFPAHYGVRQVAVNTSNGKTEFVYRVSSAFADDAVELLGRRLDRYYKVYNEQPA